MSAFTFCLNWGRYTYTYVSSVKDSFNAAIHIKKLKISMYHKYSYRTFCIAILLKIPSVKFICTLGDRCKMGF
jgi:hypothetical protein